MQEPKSHDRWQVRDTAAQTSDSLAAPEYFSHHAAGYNGDYLTAEPVSNASQASASVHAHDDYEPCGILPGGVDLGCDSFPHAQCCTHLGGSGPGLSGDGVKDNEHDAYKTYDIISTYVTYASGPL